MSCEILLKASPKRRRCSRGAGIQGPHPATASCCSQAGLALSGVVREEHTDTATGVGGKGNKQALGAQRCVKLS